MKIFHFDGFQHVFFSVGFAGSNDIYFPIVLWSENVIFCPEKLSVRHNR